MKKIFLSVAALLLLATSVVSFSSCTNEESVATPEVRATKVVEDLPQIIDKNMTLTADKEYRLVTKTFVTNGATLTIKEGVKIYGKESKDAVNASALIITRGSKIHAQGSASAPIVFTAENGQKGGWGGIVLLGKAKVNQGTDNVIEGIEEGSVPAGVDAKFGGNDDNDSSGVLSYVRVEYAGAKIHPDNELNAFTFGGVGRGTQVDHIVAFHGADDGAEFFGGCVNVRYYACIATDDDGFDADWGYTGNAQFGFIWIDKTMTYSKDPNGFEVDNDGDASDKTPYTHPVISNFTVVGTPDGKVAGTGKDPDDYLLKSAGDFRRNCQFDLRNTIMYGFPKGLLLETTNTYSFLSNIVSATTTGQEFYQFTPDSSNKIATVSKSADDSSNTIQLNNPWGNYLDNSSLKATGSPAINGTNFEKLDSWFIRTSYKGAFGGFSYWYNGIWAI